ncbi:MAG: hypothetical protein OXI95_14510 [bacterium]|nr:hypothetical protein [bacterium]
MTVIAEGMLKFDFPNSCQASKYDDWSFYRNQFQRVVNGSKAVDIVCVERDVSWLIEVKDYRRHPRTKAIDIVDEMAVKVRDTLAGLAAAARNANDIHERKHARRALASRTWRVVLHLEQSETPRKLWKNPVDSSSLLLKQRSRVLKAIDAHPIVCSRNSPCGQIPWTVR